MAGIVDEIAGRIEIAARERVLHLGFGDGEVTCRMARRAPEGMVLGVDPSDANVRAARRRAVDLDNVMFVVGSPEEIPWQDNFFSVLLTAGVTAEWARPEQAAREMFRVLGPGGRLYLAGPEGPWRDVLAGTGFEEVALGEVLAAIKPATPAARPGRDPLRVIR